MERVDLFRVWYEGVWIFGVDLVFESVIVWCWWVWNGFVGCYFELQFDQIDFGDEFGYGMFYLNVCVYFYEGK